MNQGKLEVVKQEMARVTVDILGISEPTLEGRNQKEKRIQPWSLGKGDLKHNKIQKNNEKQRNTSQMKEQTRNTEVQINEEEGNRQTTWKRIQNNDSKGDQKPWKQNG